MKRLWNAGIGVAAILLAMWLAPTSAAVIEFDLVGRAGPGLLPGNENPGASGSGSGGEIGAVGIQFDDVTLALTLNVGWGSANGFTDLTGNVTAGHLHGPADTMSNAGVLQGLTLNSDSATSGFVSQTITLSPANAASLVNGLTYLNFHTAANPGGEIRGNLVAVAIPEPSSLAMLALVSGGLAWKRRRNQP